MCVSGPLLPQADQELLLDLVDLVDQNPMLGGPRGPPDLVDLVDLVDLMGVPSRKSTTFLGSSFAKLVDLVLGSSFAKVNHSTPLSSALTVVIF